jgi:hypothetical protein
LDASIQLSLLAINAPRRPLIRGSDRQTPASGNEGPMARRMTFLGSVPVIDNAAIKTLSPVCTRNRVEIVAEGGRLDPQAE